MMEARSLNHCCRARAVSLIYFERVPITLVTPMQSARKAFSVARPALHIFPHYLKDGKQLLNIKCVFGFCLQIWHEKCLTLTKLQLDAVTTVHVSVGLHVQCPDVILGRP
jgi:hypothetical protein